MAASVAVAAVEEVPEVPPCDAPLCMVWLNIPKQNTSATISAPVAIFHGRAGSGFSDFGCCLALITVPLTFSARADAASYDAWIKDPK